VLYLELIKIFFKPSRGVVDVKGAFAPGGGEGARQGAGGGRAQVVVENGVDNGCNLLKSSELKKKE
jgi:hypothetical protein